MLAWTLIFVPLLWYVALLTMDFPSWVGARGVDVEGAVQRAAKAAAYQITSESYANADPRIDPTRAAAAAKEALAENLRLDPTTLSPHAGSWFNAAPGVQVLVANGPFPQTVDVPTHPRTRVTFPTAGVVLTLEGTIRVPGQSERDISVWAAARVYREGGP